MGIWKKSCNEINCIENISPHPISLVMKSTKAAVQQIKCHLCSFTSSYESEAKTHTASKYIDETNEYKCKTDSVEEETDQDSVESEYESDEKEEFMCNKCKKLFKTWEQLTEHNEIMCALFMEGRFCVELSECKTGYL